MLQRRTKIFGLWVVLFVGFAWLGRGQTPAPAELLTPEERAWLTAQPVLYLAPDPAYEPVEFFDEQGIFRGISADYVALIEQRLGFRFAVVNRRKVQADWDAGIVRVDAMPTCVATPERERTWLFTTPYLEFPTYLITRKSVPDGLTLAQLKGSRVAVVEGYGVREYLATNYPALILDPVQDTRTGLQKVSFGLVDAFASDLPVATYWMEREGITNLKTAGEVGYAYRLGFGMPKRVAPLHGILEKGLAQIRPEERAAIYQKWVKMPVEPSRFNRRILWTLFGGLGLACVGLLLVFGWNRSLAAQVKERTAALQQELTEREQAEKELRASQARFATAFRSSPNPVCLARFADGKILAVNDRWLELSGCTQEELVGRLDTEMGLWDDFQLRDRILALLRTRQPVRELEVTYRTKTGEQRHGLLSIEAIRLDGRRCHLWTVQDITDRKRAQEALQQSEALFRSLTETTSAWVFIAQGAKICYFNAATEAGIGYTRAEMVGQSVWSVIHPDDHQLIKERMQARQQKLPLSTGYEVRILTKTGAVRWLQITTTTIEYEQATAQLSTAFDITERKLAEEQIKISEQQLHQLAGYLQTIREEERTAMAREIHDELGQALTAMKMDLSWLLQRLPEDTEALRQRAQDLIELVNTTINTVRKLATQLRPGILDDLGLAAALEWQAQEFQTRTGIRCQFLEQSEIPELEPELATAIFRIGQESLTNVMRHAQATAVQIRLQVAQNRLRLEIKDNGRGVTEGELGNPRSLGLLGMRERAFLLGGDVQVQGKANEGTTVTAQIPLRQAVAKGGAA